MITIEIHGFGMEKAVGVRGRILDIIFNIPWTNTELDSVEICGDDCIGFNGKKRPRLQVLTSQSESENMSLISKLAPLGLPIHIISTTTFDGEKMEK